MVIQTWHINALKATGKLIGRCFISGAASVAGSAAMQALINKVRAKARK